MGSLTIRNFDDAVKRRLRIQAAMHGKSREEEARDILSASFSTNPSAATNLADAIRDRTGYPRHRKS